MTPNVFAGGFGSGAQLINPSVQRAQHAASRPGRLGGGRRRGQRAQFAAPRQQLGRRLLRGVPSVRPARSKPTVGRLAGWPPVTSALSLAGWWDAWTGWSTPSAASCPRSTPSSSSWRPWRGSPSRGGTCWEGSSKEPWRYMKSQKRCRENEGLAERRVFPCWKSIINIWPIDVTFLQE